MRLRKRDDAGSIEVERAALREQWEAIDGLKRQLAERVQAVEQRERELAAALTAARKGDPAAAPAVGFDLEAKLADLARREQELAAKEKAVAEAELRERSPAPPPDADRLGLIESRLAALAEAEKAFLRTQQELSARSEAVAARERLVAQRERELDEREDADAARPEVAELEERLRRLERQQAQALPPAEPRVEDTQGFTDGLKKLQQQGTRRRSVP